MAEMVVCPRCGASNNEGAAFCERCGTTLRIVQGPPWMSQQPLPTQPGVQRPFLAGRNLWIVIVAVAAVVILIIAGVFALFNAVTESRTPQEAIIGWTFSAGFGNAAGTADRTIAKVIGGQVLTETQDWYRSLLDSHRGNTRVDLLNLAIESNQSLDASQIAAAQNAISLLSRSYGIEVSEYRYAHFWFTGLGFVNAEKFVGVLKVGSSWYIGYATGVVDLGNI